MTDRSSSGSSPFGGSWFAGALFLLLTVAVWVSFYLIYGEAGKLDQAETTVLALVMALIVFGGRWCIGRFRRKPNRHTKGQHQ